MLITSNPIVIGGFLVIGGLTLLIFIPLYTHIARTSLSRIQQLRRAAPGESPEKGLEGGYPPAGGGWKDDGGWLYHVG